MSIVDKIMFQVLLSGAFALTSDALCAQQMKPGGIDRKAVVTRHNFHISDTKEPGPTQVGNGNFAFGFDVTGMQTLTDRFTTMSDWSWHTAPLPPGLSVSDFKTTAVKTQGRMAPYELPTVKQHALSQWLAANPHRFNLARIGLWLRNEDGAPASFDHLQNADQYVDLWTAVVVSRFKIGGYPVKVTTVGDPYKDIVAFNIESPLIASGRLGIFIEFPYASLEAFSNGSNYHKAEQHQTVWVPKGKQEIIFNRRMDSTHYQAGVRWSGAGRVAQEAPHRFRFIPSGGRQATYVIGFAQERLSALPSFATVQANAVQFWPRFWNSGGVIDLSESRDPRWKELERRIVLSQYNMKINASGNYPPQETGLVTNSWYGRFHYEMILWNMAHQALWNRWPLLENSLNVYRDNLARAKQRAAAQGYAGARYPKCTGPDGREWPHPIHAFLVWQQPHPIFFADLDYRAHPVPATLKKWRAIVDASADFLAAYASYDPAAGKFVLGTPIAAVSENNNYYKDRNPAFELSYWRYGLRTAQLLRQKQGLPGKPLWDQVYQQLAPIPQKDSLYEQWENAQQMWTKLNFEHPALLGIYGLLPGDGVDTAVMKNTLEKVRAVWKFNTGWGWDFPMAAMSAARLGEPEQAIDLLLYETPKNHFDKHGFVGGGNPYPYLPANGGLLYAVAMMTAGWDHDGNKQAPGFPKDGSWVIKWENLSKAP